MVIKRINLEKAFKKMKKQPSKKFCVWRTWGNQVDWKKELEEGEEIVVIETFVFFVPAKFVAVYVTNGSKSWMPECTTFTELEELKNKYPKLFEVEGVLEIF